MAEAENFNSCVVLIRCAGLRLHRDSFTQMGQRHLRGAEWLWVRQGIRGMPDRLLGRLRAIKLDGSPIAAAETGAL